MKISSLLYASLLALMCPAQADFSDKIKHVIVLMLENRSFDHMLGYLKQQNDEVKGCLPGLEGCSNHYDPQDATSASATVSDDAVYVQSDPHHSIVWTTSQIYGYPKGQTPPADAEPLMDGFIASYADEFGGSLEDAASIMKCFSPEHVTSITTLATEFGFFDGWHASIPGPTMVNRAYAASGTSHGMGTNDKKAIAKGYPQKTMFKQLLEMGLDYKVYFQDVPTVLQFKEMRRKEARSKYHGYSQLFTDLKTGDIPEFTWVEPAYFSTSRQAATDQHGGHDVSLGEQVIKEVYEAVRASPIWNETVFMITYDEHGGFFDHVAPPVNVPNPDGMNSTDDPFDFTRLGIRIPTVVASPYIPKGSVFHAPSQESDGEFIAGQYEHSSIVATVVHKLFSPKEGYPAPEYLTKRDAWAKTFEGIFDVESEMRTDCPMTLPEVFKLPANISNLPAQDGSMPISDLQSELISLCSGLLTDEVDADEHTSLLADVSSWTEGVGGEYCEMKLREYFATK